LVNSSKLCLEDKVTIILNPYNIILYIEPFLSRSTQESGLAERKEEKSQKVKNGINLWGCDKSRIKLYLKKLFFESLFFKSGITKRLAETGKKSNKIISKLRSSFSKSLTFLMLKKRKLSEKYINYR